MNPDKLIKVVKKHPDIPDEYLSAVMDRHALTYIVGTTTYPKLTESDIYVFDNVKNALRFRNGKSGYALLEGKGTDVEHMIPIPNVYSKDIPDFWRLVPQIGYYNALHQVKFISDPIQGGFTCSTFRPVRVIPPVEILLTVEKNPSPFVRALTDEERALQKYLKEHKYL